MGFPQIENTPRNGSCHAEFKAGIEGISEILQDVQAYLGSWSEERIFILQKMDGGWAPFDMNQRPLRVASLGRVHASGDAIHRHCIALREAGFPISPELVELDAFFHRARELIRICEETAFRMRAPETRTPSMHSHQSAFANG